MAQTALLVIAGIGILVINYMFYFSQETSFKTKLYITIFGLALAFFIPQHLKNQDVTKSEPLEKTAYYITPQENSYINNKLRQQSRSKNRTYGNFIITLPDGEIIEFNRSHIGKGTCTKPLKPIKVSNQSFPPEN